MPTDLFDLQYLHACGADVHDRADAWLALGRQSRVRNNRLDIYAEVRRLHANLGRRVTPEDIPPPAKRPPHEKTQALRAAPCASSTASAAHAANLLISPPPDAVADRPAPQRNKQRPAGMAAAAVGHGNPSPAPPAETAKTQARWRRRKQLKPKPSARSPHQPSALPPLPTNRPTVLMLPPGLSQARIACLLALLRHWATP